MLGYCCSFKGTTEINRDHISTQRGGAEGDPSPHECKSIPIKSALCFYDDCESRRANTHTALWAKQEALQPETPPAPLGDEHVHITARAWKLRRINSGNVNWITNS